MNFLLYKGEYIFLTAYVLKNNFVISLNYRYRGGFVMFSRRASSVKQTAQGRSLNVK